MNEIIGFAVVIVTIFAGILFNNSRFNIIDARFTSIDTRLDVCRLIFPSSIATLAVTTQA